MRTFSYVFCFCPLLQMTTGEQVIFDEFDFKQLSIQWPKTKTTKIQTFSYGASVHDSVHEL